MPDFPSMVLPALPPYPLDK